MAAERRDTIIPHHNLELEHITLPPRIYDETLIDIWYYIHFLRLD